MPTNEGSFPIRILFVSSDRNFVDEAKTELTAQPDLSVETAETASEALATITANTAIDCIVSDYEIPDSDGIALLQAVRAQSPTLPFILFTSEGDETLASRAITMGVTDYLIKERHTDQWDRLAGLIVDAVRYYHDQQEFIDVENRVSTILDNSSDLIGIVREGECEYLNQTGVAFFGAKDTETIVEEPIVDYFEVAGEKSFGELLERVESGSLPLKNSEAQLKRVDGETVPVQVTIASISWRTGPAAVIIARDRSTEEALKSNLSLKDEAMDEAPIGVAIADTTKPNNPLIYVNERTEEMTGYEADEIVGRSSQFLLGEQTDPDRVDELCNALEQGEPKTVQVRNYRKDGTEFWNRVSIAPIRNDNGQVTHYVGFLHDVSAEKEHERKLDRFMKAVEAAGHPIYMTEPDGEIFYVNPAFEEITGYDESEALGKNPCILKSDEMSESYYEDLWETATAGDILREVVINRRRNGDRYYAEQTIAPMIGSDGEISAYVAIQTDITERERMRQRIDIALEETDSLVFEIDLETGAVSHYGAVEKFFTVDPARIETISAFKEVVVDPEDHERFESYLEELASGECEYETLDFRTTDAVGETRWLRSHMYRDSETRLIGLGQDVTDSKEREQELREYKQAAESSKDLLAAVDEELNFLFANQAYQNYHDISKSDIQEATLSDILSEAEFEEVRTSVETALQGRLLQTTVSRTHPETGDRVLDVRLFPLEDEAGMVYGVGASMRDITADREREAAIERESEYRRLMSSVNQSLVRATDVEDVLERVTEILGSSDVFSCVFTYLLDTVESNATCKATEQLSEEEARALHTEEYIEAVYDEGILEMGDVTTEPFAQHTDPETPPHPGIALAVGHDGQRFGVLTVHFPPDTPYPEDVIDLLETIADDLGYFIANTKIRSEHKSFAEIVERIDDPVMLQNRDGSFQVANSAVEDFAGMDKGGLVGLDESAFMDEKSAKTIAEMKDRVLRAESPRSYEIQPHFPDGRKRTFATTRYPYYNEDEQLDGTIAICRDVTDLKKHQRQLQVLDRVLRHNVNNNMNVVQGYAEMIREGADGALAQYATKILKNSHQLLTLAHKQRKITDFLSDPDPIETLDLGQLLGRVVDRIAAEHPEATVSVSHPGGIEIQAIRAIEEAFEELLRNSIVHSEAIEPQPEIGVEANEDTVEIHIRDTNQPISKMDREVLADRSKLSTLRHGSGLGLWLVKLIVDRSNGTVNYTTNDPEGNLIRIELMRS